MTVKDMHRMFKISLDKVDSSSLAELLPSEIDYYLTQAQLRYIMTRYGHNNIHHKGFEESAKRTEDLKALTVPRYVTVVPYEYDTTDGYSVFRTDLTQLFKMVGTNKVATDEKYMIHIKSSIKITIGNCSSWCGVSMVRQDDIDVDLDPFNRPQKYRPKIFFEDGNIVIKVPTGATVSDYLLTFVKYPTDIYSGLYPKTGYTLGVEVVSPLSEHTHQEITQLAVSIALENLGSPRTQSQIAVNENRLE